MRVLFFGAIAVMLLMFAVPMWFAVTALFGGAIPWILFGLVLWAVCGGSRRHSRRRWDRRYWAPAPQPRPSMPPRQPQAPVRPSVNARLPLEVEVKVEQIRRKVEVLLQHASRFPLGSEDLYIVRAVIGDYLPRTLDAYMALPSGNVEGPNGKTALQELKDQLQLLDAKLDDIAEDLQRDNMDRLLANRRFLEQRFA